MDRRQALQTAAGLGVAVAPRVSAAPELPERSLLERKPEAYWKRIREEQFLLPAWRSYLNTGSLGVAPKRVVARVQEALEEGASLTRNEYPRWGYETLEAERKELAAFLGCRFDEIAFTHNATEAMSMIAGGLDLRSGDEVLITDQEHPSGRGPWLCKAARTGCTVREVKLPLPPPKPEELVDRVFSAIGPKTRVLSFSSILTTTGLIMPTREICAAARAKGVITVVDGAHHVGLCASRKRRALPARRNAGPFVADCDDRKLGR
jgi:isopenicillin-N epimerase